MLYKEVSEIEVTKIIEAINTKNNITRAYTYCQVSTDMSHQINSYESQKEYKLFLRSKNYELFLVLNFHPQKKHLFSEAL